MSSLIVEVCEIKDVKNHPNADKLDIVVIKGWECCVGKGQFQVGDLCVYFPPDSILPASLSDKLGVTKYLSNGRVRVANLRGYKSYGLVTTPELSWPVGTDVIEHYGVTKYEPPIRCTQGDAEREFPAFHKYYSMENIRNFPELFNKGEEVCITQKIHGQNFRVGKVQHLGEMVYCAGSHSVNRKEFLPDGKRSMYWECLDKCRDLIDYLSGTHNSVVIFGEIYGQGIQDMDYGISGWDFRLFDITCNGRYVPVNLKIDIFNRFSLPIVPIEYIGPFSMEKVDELTNGKSFSPSSKYDFKEGIVITTLMEQERSLECKHFNRVQAKSISFDYLNRKNGTEFH